jgi:hypothetical protein
MAALTTNVVPLTGLRFDDLLAPAAGGGDDCQTGAGVLLVVRNGDTTSKTVTLVTPGTVKGLAIEDREVTVAANGGLELIPVTEDYRDPSTGRASITYSAVTSLDVCAVRTATS